MKNSILMTTRQKVAKAVTRLLIGVALGLILLLSIVYTLSSPFKVKSTDMYEIERTGLSTYHVYLSQQVGHIGDYKDLIRGLSRLTIDDTVIIHMANEGGYVYSGVQLLHAIRSSKAYVIVKVEGFTASMGALLTCSADRIDMHPYTFLMFHGIQGLPRGESPLKTALQTMSANLMYNECVKKGILTEQEVLDMVFNDAEVYVQSYEVGRKGR